MADGVVEQVADRSDQLVRLTRNLRGGDPADVDADPVVGLQSPGEPQHQVVQVDRANLAGADRPRVAAGEVEEVLDKML